MNFNTLIWKEPWLAPIALNITAVIKTNEINTAGITPNGKTLYYNPDFWKRLRSEERLGVQLHELLHIVNLHAKRRDGRDFSKWNTACDMSINYQIKKAGYKLPASALPGEDESAEQIYDMLNTAKSPTSRNGLLSGNGQPGSGVNILADDLLKRNSDGSESFSEETAEAAESAGKLAGRGSTPLSKLYRPIASKADWRMVLRGFIKSISGDEVDYLSYEFDEYGICEDILCCKPKSKDDTACHSNQYKSGNGVISQKMIGGTIYVHYKNNNYPGSSFDIVANEVGIGEGVLIRGAYNIDNPKEKYVSQPRLLGEALKIDYNSLNQKNLLTSEEIWVENDGFDTQGIIGQKKRVGLDNSKIITTEDKNRLLRFILIT